MPSLPSLGASKPCGTLRIALPGVTTPIEDFEAYSAVVASRSVNRFFMTRSPQRTLLRSRLRYVLTTDARFRIWQSEHGAWQCSLGRPWNAVPRSQ